MILGLFLWDFTHESGVHATIAGVLLACTIPHRKKEKDFSLLVKIEHAISPYVAFGIMPLFAFANAGVSRRHDNKFTFKSCSIRNIIGTFYR